MAIKFNSILKPEGSVVAGLATGALVIGVYTVNIGSIGQMHASQAHDVNARAARKKAAVTSVAAVAAVSLLTRDITIFVLGGAVVIALDWHSRHAIAADPQTGQLVDANGYIPAGQAVPVSQQAQPGGVSYE